MTAIRFACGSVLFFGLMGAAYAADGGLPAERTQGSATYVSGGIGKDESDAMKQAASRYALILEMSSTASGRAEYVSDVKIDIRDQRGASALSVTSEGPLLLANLPPGQYTIDAAWNGKSLQRKVTVAAGAHPRVEFAFPR